jgi:1,2-phenylacetyl-CoA epoxidase PaaB subunit
MIAVERYAYDRWEIYRDEPGPHFAPFTVMAADRQQAVERAMDRMAEVNARTRGSRTRGH